MCMSRLFNVVVTNWFFCAWLSCHQKDRAIYYRGPPLIGGGWLLMAPVALCCVGRTMTMTVLVMEMVMMMIW